MINVALLNDQPQLNSYFVISSLQYIPGQTVKVHIQILNVDAPIRFMPPVAATLTGTFKKTDGTDLVVTGTKLFPSDDRSMWQLLISATDSATLVGNNFLVSLDVNGDGTDIQQGIANNALSKILFEGDC